MKFNQEIQTKLLTRMHQLVSIHYAVLSARQLTVFVKLNGDPSRPPYYKFTHNVSGQFSNMADPFEHNNIGHEHQQNSTAPEQVYPTCPAFTKIH